jgi:hypothetical protein
MAKTIGRRKILFLLKAFFLLEKPHAPAAVDFIASI